ncbi:unnamed protein product [Hydatigera taeniaeformis]|uniref:DHC_N1 domain-containing protein n=1 Tax=Hydatigena taeniaeformis TaxID=6205 RepID=A0A0R3XAS5_HYDTA|nr:unnamed protein product [Hydatigera taeniaeformis]
MEEVVLVEPWFKINAKPFKQGLSNCVKRWSLLFKNYLVDFVTNSLSDLTEFIKSSTETLQDDPKPGDYDRLVEAMSCLGAVKARQSATDSMFEPLKETADLLKSYGQEELPRRWNNLKKRVVLMKQVVAPLQSDEVAKVRKWATEFEMTQNKYYKEFLEITPFQYECEEPYTVLDKVGM